MAAAVPVWQGFSPHQVRGILLKAPALISKCKRAGSLRPFAFFFA
jgi:hypothetical protein